MPAVVDHDARRQEIATAIGRLVAREGLQAVTVRAAAKEAGYSAAVIGHYFHGKDDLMNFTYLSARDRTQLRVERARLAGKSVFECLQECLPITDSRRNDWTVWFGLWGMAGGSSALQAERRRGLTEADSLFTQVLTSAQERGEIRAGLDCAHAAQRLLMVVNGIATLWVQMPEQWPPSAQLDMLKAEIEPLLV